MPGNSNEQQDEIILELLCCVMVVDKTASATEKAHIHTILSEDGSNWTTAEVNERVMKFIARVEAQGFWPILDDACDKASALPMSRVEKLVQNCITLAKGDSEFHDRERKAIGRILKKLPQLQLGEIAPQHAASSPTYDVNIAKTGSGQPRGKPSIEPRSENKEIPGKSVWVWVIAAMFSTGFFVRVLLIPNPVSHRGWMIFLSIVLPPAIAYLARRREIERADRREMVIYVESVTPLYTTEFGHGRANEHIYYAKQLRPNRRFVVVASTVYGLKIAKVIRTARPEEDF